MVAAASPAVVRQTAPTGTALQTLLDKIAAPDPYATPARELDALRLEAARDVFTKRRAQIQVLDRRAQDTGVKEIRTFDDIVPLMFSHTTYKSYPLSFVAKGQWKRLLQWFGTLSAVPVDNVDVAGVTDIDGFLDALWAAGHVATTTSGTSGKVSFLHRVQADNDLMERFYRSDFGWPGKVHADNRHHYFLLGPARGPYLMMVAANIQQKVFARPESIRILSDETLKIASIIRAAEMRQKMADGTATPEEIAAFEKDAATQGRKMVSAMEGFFDEILAKRHEPVFMVGPWAQFWRLMEHAKARGVKPGDYHKESILASGGGLKGLKLPADYIQQMADYFGFYVKETYGMSEMSGAFPRCEAGNYHATPWIIPMVLNATGEQRLEPKGIVEGRYAFLDLSFNARWGGMITGDKVRMDYADTCACGRSGPVVLPGITRYKDLGEEDKIGCAGTIESYIRGSLAD